MNITYLTYKHGSSRCELCGKNGECRPYGPRGESICIDCGKKNPAQTERQMERILFGKTLQ